LREEYGTNGKVDGTDGKVEGYRFHKKRRSGLIPDT
jgi:hypothetical protein